MQHSENQELQTENPNRKLGWQTLLTVAGSALLGGIAVALWNRRALMEIQGHSPARLREPLENYRRKPHDQRDQPDE